MLLREVRRWLRVAQGLMWTVATAAAGVLAWASSETSEFLPEAPSGF